MKIGLALNKFIKDGWEFMLNYRDNLWEFWIYRPEDITDNLYAAKPMAGGRGNDLEVLVQNMVEYAGLE